MSHSSCHQYDLVFLFLLQKCMFKESHPLLYNWYGVPGMQLSNLLFSNPASDVQTKTLHFGLILPHFLNPPLDRPDCL